MWAYRLPTNYLEFKHWSWAESIAFGSLVPMSDFGERGIQTSDAVVNLVVHSGGDAENIK